MKTTLKIEELAQFIFGIVLFSQTDYPWWIFPLFLFVPDIGMLGYIINTRVGAITYNVFHNKAIAIAILILGMYLVSEIYMLIGIILFSHSALDRALGYGLKYSDSFKHTHLGNIGKN